MSANQSNVTLATLMPKRKKVNPVHTTALAVAEIAGVSLTTVSFVMNGQAKKYGIAEKTVQAVNEAARKLHYVPNELARSLRMQSTKAVGVVFPHLRGDWADAIMEGVYRALDADGYVPLIVNHRGDPEREAKELQSLLERRVDGILCNPISHSAAQYREVLDRGVPLVFFGDAMPDLPEAGYSAWDPQDVELAVQPLIEAGCRRIAYIAVDDTRLMASAREKVFVDTIRRAGLRVRETDLVRVVPLTPIEPYLQKLFKPVSPPDGVFVLFDNVAIEVVRYLNANGRRIPDDVKLSTFGNSGLLRDDAYAITSVAPPISEEGYAAARCLLESVADRSSPPGRHLVGGGEVHLRASTASMMDRATPRRRNTPRQTESD